MILMLILINSIISHAQVSISMDGSPPHSSSILDLQSSEKGFLPPRMTQAQRDAIPGPAEGLLVFCTDCSTESTTGILSCFRDGQWRMFEVNCDYPRIPSADTMISQRNEITWQWNNVPIATGYRWSADDNFASAEEMGLLTTKHETGLHCWSAFTRYVWAYNDCGPSDSLIITANTLPVTFSPAPTAGEHFATSNQITWTWNAVGGAAGYKWSTGSNFSSAEDLGSLTERIEPGLNCGTPYTRYVWAYDSCGFSQPTMLTRVTDACSGDCQQFTDSRDGQIYFTVLIDTVCWMAENLNIGTKIDSTLSPSNNAIIEKQCYHDQDSLCEIYGGLYQWFEMMQYNYMEGTQGICPTGWHLPTWTEWWNLINYLGGTAAAGGKMKEVGYGHWFEPNIGATNESGFTALPGGMHSPGQAYQGLGYSGKFWSSTQYPPDLRAGSFGLSGITESILPATVTSKYNQFSVRCVKD